MRDDDEERFLGLVLGDPTVGAVLDRAPQLGVPDWWLTAGVLFQTVWNALTDRPPGTGVRDADFFYFDPDTSWAAEDAVIRRGAELFADLPVPVEIRNQARVHLWYADHFAAVCCCHGVRRTPAGDLEVYAPHGYGDLFDLVVRPNRRLAPQSVYEAKAVRWSTEWPQLTVLPWNTAGPAVADG